MSAGAPDRAARAARPPRTRPLRLALRALAAVALALVPLGVLERSPFVPARYALVLDDSPSVRRRFPGFVEETRALWSVFEGGTHPVVGAGEHPRPAGDAGGAGARFTDLPAALRAAALLGTPGVETRILLVTDGLTRSEGLDETRRLLRERGARVFALAPPPPRPQARVVDIALPERVFLWEPFSAHVRVQASRPGPVTVRLSRNGGVVAQTQVAIDESGSADVEFPLEVDRVGRARYAAAVAGSDAPAAACEVSVAQSPRVRWLSEDVGTAGPLVGFFREAGIDVALSHPADLAFPQQDLAQDEVIVLDDVPAAALTDDLVEALRRAVGARGAGLVVLGGRKGLGSGEYAGSALEAALPVTAGFQSPPAPESVALALVFDTSFSMAYRGRGASGAHGADPRKIDVARQSAEEVVRIVRPGDRLGILGNSTDVFWIAPLGPIADRATVLARLEQVEPRGDGLYFYSAINEAREALRRDPGGVRHVLVLCDAEDIDQYEIAGRGHSFDLLRAMAREGITVSILAIGSPVDKDVPFLRTAALLGGGDFYLVQRIAALPRYFVSEYRRLSSARRYLEEEVQPVGGESAPVPGGAAETLPPLSGMALVTARAGTRTLLQAPFGAPVLVAGEYGRGRTEVFAGDDGYRWAARWVGAAGPRRFWLQLLFRAAPAGERARGFASSLDVERGTGRLLLHYAGGEAALPAWDALWALPAEGETGAPAKLDRVGLRTYRSLDPAGPVGYRRVRIAEDPEGARPLLTSGYAVGVAEEDLPAAPRWEGVQRLLQETGGGWVQRPAELAPPARLVERAGRHAAVLLVAGAVLLLLVEVVVRTLWEE